MTLVAFVLLVQSVTKAVVLITSCVVVRDVKGTQGESQFYLSLEDELMRRFGSDRIKQVLERLNADDEDIVIKSRMLTRQVEAAQKRVEGNNYEYS